MKIKHFWLGIISVMILGCTNITTVPLPSKLTEDNFDSNLIVHYIDVGQGDSILIQHEDTNILIDAGSRSESHKLVTYLKSTAIESVDIFVATHPHEDHIGGFIELVNHFEIKAVYDSGFVHTTKTFNNYLTVIDNNEIPFKLARRGDTLFESNDLHIEILHPAVLKEDINGSSIVLLMKYQELTFLFMGDVEKNEEEELLQMYPHLYADVIKIGHHGSSTSSTDAFIKKVNPEISVVMVGENNKYNHPNESVINRLEFYGSKVYRTDLHGTVVIHTDGQKIAIQTKGAK